MVETKAKKINGHSSRGAPMEAVTAFFFLNISKLLGYHNANLYMHKQTADNF